MNPDTITADTLMLAHRIATEYAVNDVSSLSDAVRDMGTLEYIAERAQTFDSNIDAAAWLLWSVSTMHPFVEGNKRTALLSCQYALDDQLMNVVGREESLDADIRDIAAGNRDLDHVRYFVIQNVIMIHMNIMPIDDQKDPEELKLRWFANNLSELLIRLSA